MTLSFGARMRSHRERRGIGLDAIARTTKIGVPLLEAIERNDASRLPGGIYRRGFVRAYATAIGLDPESTLGEFLERFPDPDDTDRSNGSAASTSARGEALRLTLAEEPWHPSLHALRAPWPRLAAAACDLAMALAVAAALFAIAGRFWICLTVATIVYYFAGMILVGTSPAAHLIRRRPRASVGDSQAKPIDPPLDAAAEPEHVAPFSPRRYPKAV